MQLTRLRANNLTKKGQKFLNWLGWLEKLFARRKILVDTDSCAYGKTHLVSKPQKIGGGWLFFSKSCSGCEISRREMNLYRQTGKTTGLAPNCALLLGPLFIADEVKEGQEVVVPFVSEYGLTIQKKIGQGWAAGFIPKTELEAEDPHGLPTLPPAMPPIQWTITDGFTIQNNEE